MKTYKKALKLLEEGRPFSLATVIRATGSTPQKAGARAIFEPGGAIWGTLGGGCLEAEARRRALLALDAGKPEVFDLNLDDDYGWDDGLICGGKVRIFVDPDVRKNAAAYRQAVTAFDTCEKGLLVTALDRASGEFGAARWLSEGECGGGLGKLGGATLTASLDEEKPRHFADGDAEYFVEPVVPLPPLLIAGGGHVGQATARFAAMLGFDVTVVDDRPGFTDPQLFPPSVRTVCGNIASEVMTRLTPQTYLVIVTRGHRHDAEVLAACIHLPARYVGMIGSKRKIAVLRKKFLREGAATPEQLDRVFSPVGLDIGALTVEEIAVSICAQLIAVRRKRIPSAEPVVSIGHP